MDASHPIGIGVSSYRRRTDTRRTNIMKTRILPIVALAGALAMAEATLGSAAQPPAKPPSEGNQATKKYRFYVRHMTGKGKTEAYTRGHVVYWPTDTKGCFTAHALGEVAAVSVLGDEASAALIAEDCRTNERKTQFLESDRSNDGKGVRFPTAKKYWLTNVKNARVELCTPVGRCSSRNLAR
jgi:hypothetical protein